MSRIGKLPVELPKEVTVKIDENLLVLKGPKGSLKIKFPRKVKILQSKDQLKVEVKGSDKASRSIHGTYRALVANGVEGVTQGWSKQLEMVGTGYKAQLNGNTLSLIVGFSHPVEIKAPEGISFKVDKNDLTVAGIDKELVGQVAAKIRSVRPPEPYKGKGIKYKDEVIRRKPGKAAKAAGAAAV